MTDLLATLQQNALKRFDAYMGAPLGTPYTERVAISDAAAPTPEYKDLFVSVVQVHRQASFRRSHTRFQYEIAGKRCTEAKAREYLKGAE